MRVTLAGSVDSGKTTLYAKLTGDIKKQYRGRTERISVYRRPDGIDFIDSPGHEGLTASREDAIRMADLVLFVVDSQKPSYDLLKYLDSIPYIVILNKWDLAHPPDTTMPLHSLATGVRRDQLYNTLSGYSQSLAREGLVAHPFLDISRNEDIPGCLCPVAASTGWGFDLLNNLLRRYAANNPGMPPFLYRESEDIFLQVGQVTGSDRLPSGLRVGDALTQKKNRWILKKGCRQDGRILGLNGSKPHRLTINYNRSLSQDLQKFLLHHLLPIHVSTDTDEQWVNLEGFLTMLGVKPSRVSKRAAELIIAQKKECILLLIGPECQDVSLTPLSVVLASSSIIGLIMALTRLPAVHKKLERRALEIRYSHVSIIQTDPRYLFLDDRLQKIIGCKLLDGILKPGSALQIYDQTGCKRGETTVSSIKDKDESKSSWGKKNCYFAIKIRLLKPVSFENKLYLISSVILKQWVSYSTVIDVSQDGSFICQRILKAKSPG